jgi:GTPase SAR1 family protein
LVFDVTNESSFFNVRNWIGEIQSNTYSDHVDMILVGNKCDLDKERVITKLRALEFAQQYKVEYIETSAVQNTNVAESVELLLNTVMNRLEKTGNYSKPNQSLPRRAPEDPDNRNLDGKLGRKTELSYCCYY